MSGGPEQQRKVSQGARPSTFDALVGGGINAYQQHIAGAKVDATSEYWVPPDPTTVVEGTYGKVPDALFK